MREDSSDNTFCFVDIAGYTALTGSHGAEAAAKLVQEFEDMLHRAMGESGSIHEIIGDCAFLVFPDVPSCCSCLLKLFQQIDSRENFPVARAGFHQGSALFKNNRYFGSTVNLAARISAYAKGGQLLCTRVAAEALLRRLPAGVRVEPMGAVRLRNIPEPVELYEVTSANLTRDPAIDPVCKMQVARSGAAGHIIFEGDHYYFCSIECVKRFVRSPANFLDMDA